MQGRLTGKRMHANFFLEHILENGTEGCNYLLAVDVDMNTVDGYAMSSWERGYGDFFFDMDLSTLRRISWALRGRKDSMTATSVRDWPVHWCFWRSTGRRYTSMVRSCMP